MVFSPLSVPSILAALDDSPRSSSLQGTVLPRREFWMQNVASGGLLTATGLADNKDTANITVGTAATASIWHFVHTTDDRKNGERGEMFAIATGFASQCATLDHFRGRFITAKYARYWPENSCHMWKVLPRDGAFVFMNVRTGYLLAQSRAHVGDVKVVAVPDTGLGSPESQWRLVDAATGQLCPVLYDSTLSTVPSELARSSTNAVSPGQSAENGMLRSEVASAGLLEQFVHSLTQEHETVREMLGSGYAALVVAPQLIRGARNGRVKDVSIQDEETVLGIQRLRDRGGSSICKPT